MQSRKRPGETSRGLPFRRLPFFYGWIIVAASTLGMLFSIPGQTIGVSVFTDFLIDSLGISRDQLSLAYMIGTLSSAAILSFSGMILDRWGSRKYGMIVSLLLGSVLIGLSFIDSALAAVQRTLASAPPVLTAMVFMSVGFFLLRFLGQGSMTLVSRNLPMRWFTRRRGLVSAIVGTFVSFAFNAAPALYDVLIRAAGWNGAWRISGVAVLILGSAMFAILVRESPESVGLNQDGIPPASEPASERAIGLKNETGNGEDDEIRATAGTGGEDHHFGEDRDLPFALRTIRFWVFGIGLGLASLYVTGFTFHVVSIFAESGLSREVAVGVFIPVSVISVVLNIGVSAVSDHIRLKWILVLQLAGLLISMVSVALLRPGFLFPALIILGNGLSGGTFNALTTLVWPRFFGTRHLGAISGFAMGMLVFGSALGPIILSASLSIAGSYGGASVALGGIGVVLLLGAIVLKEDPPR
jgi:OFA family oxalate/formate antiporter-like MFS transporter